MTVSDIKKETAKHHNKKLYELGDIYRNLMKERKT